MKSARSIARRREMELVLAAARNGVLPKRYVSLPCDQLNMNNSLIHRTSAISTLLLCVLVSCSDQSSQPSEQTVSNLLPLAVGNQWISQRLHFDSLGHVLSYDPPESLRIRADTLIEGSRWFYHDYLGHLLAYRNSETGSLTRLVSPNTDGKTYLAYKQPARVGESYGFPIVVFSGYNAWLADTLYRCSIISLDSTASVPAGTFHCFQFRVVRLSSGDWWDEFLAPNYGWIRKDYYVRFGPGGGIYRIYSMQATSISIRQ
jgi:hypothetical protein